MAIPAQTLHDEAKCYTCLGVSSEQSLALALLQRIVNNTSTEDDLLTGMIVMWSGTIATIPAGYQLCDGTNGTPDLRDRFVVCARQDSAGIARTNLTGALTQSGGNVSHSHGVTDPNHQHTVGSGIIDAIDLFTGGDIDDAGGAGSFAAFLAADTVTNPNTGNSPTGITVNSQSAPQPYFALAYIMKL